MLFELLQKLREAEYGIKVFPLYSPTRRVAAAAMIQAAIHILEDDAITYQEVASVRNKLIDYMKEHPAVDAGDIQRAITDTQDLLADPILDFHAEPKEVELEDGVEFMSMEEMDALEIELKEGAPITIREAFEVEAEQDGTILAMKIFTKRPISNVNVNSKDETVTIRF